MLVLDSKQKVNKQRVSVVLGSNLCCLRSSFSLLCCVESPLSFVKGKVIIMGCIISMFGSSGQRTAKVNISQIISPYRSL